MRYIAWIDDLKGLAITLIVAGHVVATIANMVDGAAHVVLQAIFDFIYMFHVPLFFVLAGLTFSTRKKFGEFVKAKFFRLMVPYYVWGFLSAAAFVMMGQAVSSGIQAVSTTSAFAEKTLHGAWWMPFVSIIHAGGWPDGKGFCFNGVLWFLPVMFVCECVYYWIARLCEGKSFRVLVCAFFLWLILLYIAPLTFLQNVPFNLFLIFPFLPFLAIGHWISMWYIQKVPAGCNRPLLVICGLILFMIALVYCVPALGVSKINRIGVNVSVYYIKWFIRAIVIVVFILIIGTKRLFCVFSRCAKCSMGIMLIHKFPIVAYSVLASRYRFWANSVVCMMIEAVILTCAIELSCWSVTLFLLKKVPWSLGVKTYDGCCVNK